MRLRSHLALALLAIIVPAVAIAFAAVAVYHVTTRDLLETSRLDLARALTLVVDREVDVSLNALRVLAASRHLRTGDLASFDRDAREAVKQGMPWENLLLYSPDARQLVNLRLPFGSPLSRSAAPEHVTEVVRTRAPRVSDMFVAAVSGSPAVQVAIPAIVEGQVRYVLGATIALARLSDLLDHQRVPPDSICSLVDRNYVLIARTRARETFVGQRATADLIAQVTTNREGTFLTHTKDGQRVYAAFSRSSLTGWTIALGMPATALTQPFTASLAALAGIAALAVAAGIGTAFVIAKRLSSGIFALAAAAPHAMGGGDVRLDRLPVAELDQVSEAIHQLLAVADRRREVAERLAGVTRMLSHSLELPRVVEAIVESVQQLLQVEMAVLYRLDDAAGDLTMVAGVGTSVRWNPRLSLREGAVGIAVRQRRAISTPDVLNDPQIEWTPEARANLEASSHRAVLAAPLIVRDVPIGGLAVGAALGRVYTPEEVALVERFADQAASALENARLYDEARRRRSTAESLVELGRVVSRSLDPEEVGQQIADSVWRLLDAESAGVYRLEDESGDLIALAVSGPDTAVTRGVRVPRGMGTIGRAVRDRQPITSADLLTDPDVVLTSELRQLTVRQKMSRSVLAVPLVANERVVGAIAVGHRRGWRFDDEQVRLVQLFADQAALALDHARLYEETRRRLRDTEALLAVSQAAGTTGEPLEALRRITRLLVHAIGADTGGLLAFDAQEDRVVPLAGYRVPAELQSLIAEGPMPLQHSFFDAMRRLDAPLCVADSQSDARVRNDPWTRSFAHKSLMVVPVRVKDEVRAAFTVAWTRDVHAFTSEELRLVEGIAGQAALGIETLNVDVDAAYAAQNADVHVGPYVVLVVGDTGCGMDAATLARIFEPFFTTKEPGKGTGLGLATVYGIVKQSGWHIAVQSEPGRGTTFKVYLPAAVESVAAEDDRRRARPRRGSETVLLVEDEEDLRDLVAEALEASGYAVLKGADCADALTIAAEHAGPIHLLLTDVVMPQMSGRELAERIQRHRPAMTVLYMSGYADGTIGQHGVLEPGIALLQKPFAPETVAHKVREVLDRRRPSSGYAVV